MKLIDWEKALQNVDYDDAVGIKIVKLNENKYINTYLTVLDAKKSVNPHYHKEGDEYYHIINVMGVMKLKHILTNKESQFTVKSGQSFIVEPNYLHQLENISDEPLTLMFSCPASHLSADRYFV